MSSLATQTKTARQVSGRPAATQSIDVKPMLRISDTSHMESQSIHVKGAVTARWLADYIARLPQANKRVLAQALSMLTEPESADDVKAAKSALREALTVKAAGESVRKFQSRAAG